MGGSGGGGCMMNTSIIRSACFPRQCIWSSMLTTRTYIKHQSSSTNPQEGMDSLKILICDSEQYIFCFPKLIGSSLKLHLVSMHTASTHCPFFNVSPLHTKKKFIRNFILISSQIVGNACIVL